MKQDHDECIYTIHMFYLRLVTSSSGNKLRSLHQTTPPSNPKVKGDCDYWEKVEGKARERRRPQERGQIGFVAKVQNASTLPPYTL